MRALSRPAHGQQRGTRRPAARHAQAPSHKSAHNAITPQTLSTPLPMARRARLRPRGQPCTHARQGAQPASAAATPPRPRRAQSRPRRACALKRCVLSGVSRGWRARAGAGLRRVLPGVYSSGFDGKMTFSSTMQLICSAATKKPLESGFVLAGGA